MSLAWGSKFLEYSATADIVNTPPAVVRCPKGLTKLARCTILRTPRRVSDFKEISPGCKVKFKTICEIPERLLCAQETRNELRSARR
jgi:hypothetical protein